MNDGKTVPLHTLTLYGLWGWVFASLLTAWLLMAFNMWHVAAMFGFTSSASAAVAVAATGRCNANRVCRLLRNLHGIQGSGLPGPELHRVP